MKKLALCPSLMGLLACTHMGIPPTQPNHCNKTYARQLGQVNAEAFDLRQTDVQQAKTCSIGSYTSADFTADYRAAYHTALCATDQIERFAEQAAFSLQPPQTAKLAQLALICHFAPSPLEKRYNKTYQVQLRSACSPAQAFQFGELDANSQVPLKEGVAHFAVCPISMQAAAVNNYTTGYTTTREQFPTTHTAFIDRSGNRLSVSCSVSLGTGSATIKVFNHGNKTSVSGRWQLHYYEVDQFPSEVTTLPHVFSIQRDSTQSFTAPAPYDAASCTAEFFAS